MKNLSLKFIVFLFSIVFYSCESEVVFEDSTTAENLNNSTDGNSSFDDQIIFDPDPDPDGGGTTGGSGTNTSQNLSNRFQYFHRGRSSNSIFSSFSSTGSGGWSTSRNVGIGEISEGAISATQFGNRLVVAHRGNNSSTKIFYATSNNGNNFGNSREVNNGARTDGDVEIVGLNNQAFIYHRGRDGSNQNRVFYSVSSNLINWGGNQRINNGGIRFNNFDVIENRGTIFLLGVSGGRLSIQSSIDGINFRNINSNAISSGGVSSISVTKIRDTFYLLLGRGANTGQIELSIAESSDNFRTVSTPRPIRVNGSVARTDKINGSENNTASIAASDNRLVVAFEENFGRRIFFAYSDNRGISWAGNRAATGETRSSSVDIIYTRQP